MTNYREINRKAWAYLAQSGCDSSHPYGTNEFAAARQWLDPRRWIPWNNVSSVLCLACGGGQQAPLFASLGCRVTVADVSPDQLNIDREVAARYGFEIEVVEADMLDLSFLYGRGFDLVYQAISACYVPDVRRLYREVFHVLKCSGYYRVEHWNPTHLQLPERRRWDGSAYRITRTHALREPIPYTPWDKNADRPGATCWHFFHPLDALIGGLCDAGFVIVRFGESTNGKLSGEPGSHTHLAAYLPSFFSLLARRRG